MATLNTQVRGKQIQTATISGGHLDAYNSPADGYVLSWNDPLKQFEWILLDNLIINETPSGDVNGVNKVFTLDYTPVSNSEQVHLNGLLQEPGVSNDYTIVSGTITFDEAPLTDDILMVTYLVGEAGFGGSTDDHGDLAGLNDDDHPQYILADGTRAFTGTIDGVTPTEDAHLVTKGYVDDRVSIAYGVEWDEDDSSPTLTRLGTLANFASGSSPGNSVLPIQAQMRRCILNDSGEVQYYLNANDSTKKEDGSTASDLTGGDGQVMVEISKFAYRYTYNAVTNKHQWWVSPVLLPGFKWHPAFNKNEAVVDHRYIGAYEGSMWDDSESEMVPAANIIDNMYASGDKLCSVMGASIYPKTNETRAEFRSMAAERGTGWRQQDYDLVSAIQLLYVTEYASWYSQSVIGAGRTDLSGGTWTAGSLIGICGLSNSDGNGTNSVQNGGSNYGTDYMTYRGIENFFGNIYKWVDGFNINDNIPYVSNTDTDFADDTTTNYTRLEDTGGSGITLAADNNYQTTLEQTGRGFLPSAVGGSSSTYITDYYYQDTGWRVARLGGVAADGGRAGFFYWRLNSSSSDVTVTIGGRVCF